MKFPSILIICLSSLNLSGQDVKTEFDGHKWEAPYYLPIPKDWGLERFLIPISFAPQIPYKGVEDIRFAPGWANTKTDEYWTYAFLWYLDGTPETDSRKISDNIKAYYSGLIKANVDSVKLGRLPEESKQVTTSFKEFPAATGDLKTYHGTVEMPDYMTLKSIRLYCIVHQRICPEDNKTIMFYELSPMSYNHEVWKGLNKLWQDFKCKKAEDRK